MTHIPVHLRMPLRLLVAAMAAVLTLTLLPAPRADAAVTATTGVAAVAAAASVAGTPYRTGGASPRTGFDCSGLVTYVYKTRLKRAVPRTADQQYRASIHLRKNQMRKGDLVFFLSAGHAYHVGIYAGGNKMWHAPKPGKSVRLVTIWTTSWVGGRVR